MRFCTVVTRSICIEVACDMDSKIEQTVMMEYQNLVQYLALMAPGWSLTYHSALFYQV